MQVAYFADSLYQMPTAGGARYTVELARELARMPGIDLRLMTLYSPEDVAAKVKEKGYPFAESLPVPLSRKVQYLLWHFAGLSGSLAQAVGVGGCPAHAHFDRAAEETCSAGRDSV